MPFVELFVPKGSLSEAQRKKLETQLVAEVMRVEGAPDTPAARAISWLVLHEVDTWSVGGQRVRPDEAPRYVVRIAVPAGSLDYWKRAEMMRRVNDVLVEIDGDPDRLRRAPDAWIHIVEIPEGSWGAFGRVVGFRDIVAHVVGEGASS
jgi:phenylpyruvate tautomerase PptA (4-oxalocrotonate tautomerase family)